MTHSRGFVHSVANRPNALGLHFVGAVDYWLPFITVITRRVNNYDHVVHTLHNSKDICVFMCSLSLVLIIGISGLISLREVM